MAAAMLAWIGAIPCPQAALAARRDSGFRGRAQRGEHSKPQPFKLPKL